MDVSVVVSSTSSHITRIKAALSLVNGCQRFFRVVLATDGKLDKRNKPVNAFELIEDWLSKTSETNHAILVTEDLLDDNWFSHEYRDQALITIGDWEQYYAPPSLRAYLTYQIAQALIHFAADMSEEMALNMVHEPPVACMYDMATQKTDIKFGMIGGNLCPVCVAQLIPNRYDHAAIGSGCGS